MNDTINLVSTNSSNTSTAGVASKSNAALEGRDGEETTDASVGDESFHDLIHNAVEEPRQEKGKTGTESSGNSLPKLDDTADAPAEDGRRLAVVDFSLSDQNNILNQPVNVRSESNLLSIDTNIEQGMKGLTSEIRQLLKLEPKVAGQLINEQVAQSASSTTTSINNAIEKPLIPQSDISQLSAEQFELLNQKSQGLTTATNQQQMLPDIQASLLLRTASAQGEFNADALPLMVNASSPNTAPINLQSIPQAEIVETFARPAWSQGMGKQILWMVQQNISSAEIRLNPAHLGPIEVRIDMSDDQVNVALSSRHAVVREAMEMALPKLREMFDANGLNLADTDISQHSFAEQREQNTADNNNRQVIGENSDQANPAISNDEAIKQSTVVNGMVDYYI